MSVSGTEGKQLRISYKLCKLCHSPMFLVYFRWLLTNAKIFKISGKVGILPNSLSPFFFGDSSFWWYVFNFELV